MTISRQFYPGQKVRVVPEPTECSYGWVPYMDSFCGRECTIEKAMELNTGWWIELKESGPNIAWCENCFVEDNSLDISAETIKNLL